MDLAEKWGMTECAAVLSSGALGVGLVRDGDNEFVLVSFVLAPL